MPEPTKSILLVEDDVQLRILLSAILIRSGYRVRAAEDGFSALAEIRTDVPDVILSDLFMLGMSGFELLSVIRRRFPSITVVAMSSAFSGGDVPVGVAADAFYQKATSVASLLHTMQETVQANDTVPTKRGSEHAPIWIATHPPESGADELVVITCPECMRTFAHTPGSVATVVRRTDCTFCYSQIHYAMVRTVDPGPPPTLWQQLESPAAS